MCLYMRQNSYVSSEFLTDVIGYYQDKFNKITDVPLKDTLKIFFQTLQCHPKACFAILFLRLMFLRHMNQPFSLLKEKLCYSPVSTLLQGINCFQKTIISWIGEASSVCNITGCTDEIILSFVKGHSERQAGLPGMHF